MIWVYHFIFLASFGFSQDGVQEAKNKISVQLDVAVRCHQVVVYTPGIGNLAAKEISIWWQTHKLMSNILNPFYKKIESCGMSINIQNELESLHEQIFGIQLTSTKCQEKDTALVMSLEDYLTEATETCLTKK